jgi:membrane-associated phospholipid phosphatase
MNATDRIVQLIITVFIIVGVYQFYFWCQRHYAGRPRELRLAIDDQIPFKPAWVWVYSFLYYPVIAYINLVVESPRHFMYVALSYVLLLGFQMAFFVLFPVSTPEAWRNGLKGGAPSIRFLKFVQSFDARSNSFPSMHTSVATLTAMHLLPYAGRWAFSFPVLIAVSCV